MRERVLIPSVLLLVFACSTSALCEPVTFTLLTHADNFKLLPQPKGLTGTSGDHILRTPDDVTDPTFNPSGCFSFNFMNPVGVLEPDYPPGYVEGIHSMTGSLVLDVDLRGGGPVTVTSMALDGFVSTGKPTAKQRLVKPGDAAANGTCGPIDGLPNTGTFTASPNANWAFTVTVDWYYDTPYAGAGTIDMTFDNYSVTGFIIPVSFLNQAGMGGVTLSDPLGYFGGTSVNFENWLLEQVVPRLPAQATYILFAQAEAHPAWANPDMGMTAEGIVAQTIIACTTKALLAGDVNEDCRVDILDLIGIRNRLGADPVSSPGAAACDVTLDGKINILDLLAVRNKLGTRCQ